MIYVCISVELSIDCSLFRFSVECYTFLERSDDISSRGGNNHADNREHSSCSTTRSSSTFIGGCWFLRRWCVIFRGVFPLGTNRSSVVTPSGLTTTSRITFPATITTITLWIFCSSLATSTSITIGFRTGTILVTSTGRTFRIRTGIALITTTGITNCHITRSCSLLITTSFQTTIAYHVRCLNAYEATTTSMGQEDGSSKTEDG